MSETRARLRPAAVWLIVAALVGAGGFAVLREWPPDDLLEMRGATMGTSYSVKWVGVERAQVRPAVQGALQRVNALYSTYDDTSEISRFNAHRSTEPFEATAAFMELVRDALEIAEKTGGAFDPTVGPLVVLRGLKDREARDPTEAEVAAALARVGYEKLESMPDGRLRKAVSDLELDLNALAKGHGVDEVASVLAALGITTYMVEIGGEVRCGGHKPDGQPWKIGIEEPSTRLGPPRRFREVVEVVDFAMATSGTYRNYVGEGEARTHHILDPRTGGNAHHSVVSVSVRASTCALADGLATAFMVRGPGGTDEVLARFSDPRLAVLFLLTGADGGIEERPVRWR